jgi:putative ABC transport system ATP-binding protein
MRGNSSSPPREGAEVVRVRSVSKFYTSGSVPVPALQNIDLTVRAAEFTALVGPSGSGKTTLLNLIGALDHPSSGSIELDGTRLDTLSKQALAEIRLHRLGFIFQEYNLVPVLSSVENVEFVLLLRGVPPAERRRRALEVLGDLGLADLSHRRPAEMSGGQQQRVAVARAIVGEPALVLADEPTANLDSVTGDSLMSLLRDMNEQRGITFLFSTHDPLVIGQARRIVRLRDGRIVEDSAANSFEAVQETINADAGPRLA